MRIIARATIQEETHKYIKNMGPQYELLQEWLRQRRQMVMKKRRRSYHVPLTKEVADIKKTYN